MEFDESLRVRRLPCGRIHQQFIELSYYNAVIKNFAVKTMRPYSDNYPVIVMADIPIISCSRCGARISSALSAYIVDTAKPNMKRLLKSLPPLSLTPITHYYILPYQYALSPTEAALKHVKVIPREDFTYNAKHRLYVQ